MAGVFAEIERKMGDRLRAHRIAFGRLLFARLMEMPEIMPATGRVFSYGKTPYKTGFLRGSFYLTKPGEDRAWVGRPTKSAFSRLVRNSTSLATGRLDFVIRNNATYASFVEDGTKYMGARKYLAEAAALAPIYHEQALQEARNVR